jgi:hypothetical protein
VTKQKKYHPATVAHGTLRADDTIGDQKLNEIGGYYAHYSAG